MSSYPHDLPTQRRSGLGRFVLWALALVLAFVLGSIFREPIVDGLTSGRAEPSALAVSVDESQLDLSAQEQAVVRLFEGASPSVVFITTVEPRRIGFTRVVTEAETGSGSGFVWDREGRIVTNYHVIRSVWDAARWRQMPNNKVRVTLADQSEWDARVLGVAPEKDLAVLETDAPRDKLQPLQRGPSANLQVGQSVFAIGNPFGLDQSLTTGVVSALNREIRSLERTRIIRNVIQTDAAINPGNSGGPLLDSAGRLIGVNTQIYSPSGASAGIGFAIPSETLYWVVPDLIEWGMIARPTLGLEHIDEQYLRRQGLQGVLVVRVTPGSGAASAGLRETTVDQRGLLRQLGDVIVGAAGHEVRNFDDLLRTLENLEEGDVVELEILRDNRRLTVDVELGPSNAERLSGRR